ncbi:MAG: sensor histidine kinase [Ardenticatenaceae bacterium]|nr:sensor histidine kinase [Ardenticatenaceae bacterium]
MSEPVKNPRDAWERFRWIWIISYYATLAASVFGALFDSATTAADRPVIWGLSAVIGISQAVVFYIYRLDGDYRRRWIPTAIIFALQIACFYILVYISPVFYIHLFSLFSQVNTGLPRRLAWVANIVLTLAIAIPQIYAFGISWQSLILFGVMGAVSIAFGLWIDGIIQQSAERRDLVAQLQKAQDELVAAERREARLEERSRLARDIHDTLAQSFIGVITHLEAVGQVTDGDPQKIAFHVQQAEAVARDGLGQARGVVHDLRPQVLEQNKSLGHALSQEARKWAARTGIELSAEITGPEVQLHPEVEVSLLRALQEALANVAKHARATAVQVTLSYIGNQVILDISDNGRGIQPGHHPPSDGGFGLQAMQERVAEIRGELHVESEPGEGVNLAIIVNLKS